MKVRISIFYKDSIFDPQGNTVLNSLQKLGFTQVSDVRIGKVIDITLKEDLSSNDTKKVVEEMCKTLLVNPVIESYSYELIT